MASYERMLAESALAVRQHEARNAGLASLRTEVRKRENELSTVQKAAAGDRLQVREA